MLLCDLLFHFEYICVKKMKEKRYEGGEARGKDRLATSSICITYICDEIVCVSEECEWFFFLFFSIYARISVHLNCRWFHWMHALWYTQQMKNCIQTNRIWAWFSRWMLPFFLLLLLLSVMSIVKISLLLLHLRARQNYRLNAPSIEQCIESHCHLSLHVSSGFCLASSLFSWSNKYFYFDSDICRFIDIKQIEIQILFHKTQRHGHFQSKERPKKMESYLIKSKRALSLMIIRMPHNFSFRWRSN